MRKFSLPIAAVLLTACATTRPITAEPHPQALHALAELHLAHVYLEVPSAGHVVSLQAEAARQINAAMSELHQVVGDDAKRVIANKFSVDSALPRAQRFAKALELLQQAQDDCSSEAYSPSQQGIREAVIHDIDQAEQLVKRAIDHARAA